MEAPLSKSSKAYALLSHVFACLHGSHVVILDLKEDRYLWLDRERSKELTRYVDGWPLDVGTKSDGALSNEDVAEETIVSLLELGLIARFESGANRDETPSIREPSTELSMSAERRTIASLGNIARCCWASHIARRHLHRRSLEKVITGVARMKLKKVRRPMDLRLTSEVVGAFTYFRPYFRSSKDACLFESLSLLRLLSTYDMYPSWVFAIQTEPFLAHCWLQYEDVVINDTVENVRQFTPIMVV
jgi:transglutaminase superfamily protein